MKNSLQVQANSSNTVICTDNLFIRLQKLLKASAIAIIITLCLLWLMQYLILSKQQSLQLAKDNNALDFIRIKHSDSGIRKNNRPKKPPPPVAPPSQPPPPQQETFKPSTKNLALNIKPFDIGINMQAGFNLAPVEGNYLPIVKVAPLYPRRAQSKGIEGHCVVKYTVTKTGAVKDVSVIESECTSYLFKSVSIKAALKFKYKPRIIDGNAIEVPGVRNMFNFRINKK